MSGPVEREFKLFLPSESALEAVAQRLGGPRLAPVQQENHFLDTPSGALRAARLALRLRAEAGRHLLTLKGPAERSGSLAERPEEEREVAAPVAAAILSGRHEPLGELPADSALVQRARACVGDSPLHVVGTFRNERTRIGPLPFPGADDAPLTFELDRTTFGAGTVERELEVEIPDAAHAPAVAAALHALLEELGLPIHSPASKASRLFRILDARKTDLPGTRRGPG